MDISEVVRLPDPKQGVRLDIREVVADIAGKPEVFVRVKITGWHFPHRAEEPFMVIGKIVSRRVLISRDSLSASGYFDRLPTRAKQVSFGYGRTIGVDFPLAVDPKQIARLDRRKLDRSLNARPSRADDIS
jgi:hypothetical protein